MFHAFLCIDLYISSLAIILKGKRKLVDSFNLSSWFLVVVVVLCFFLAVPCFGQRSVSVLFPDHTNLFISFIFFFLVLSPH